MNPFSIEGLAVVLGLATFFLIIAAVNLWMKAEAQEHTIGACREVIKISTSRAVDMFEEAIAEALRNNKVFFDDSDAGGSPDSEELKSLYDPPSMVRKGGAGPQEEITVFATNRKTGMDHVLLRLEVSPVAASFSLHQHAGSWHPFEAKTTHNTLKGIVSILTNYRIAFYAER